MVVTRCLWFSRGRGSSAREKFISRLSCSILPPPLSGALYTTDPGNTLSRYLRRLQPGSTDWIVSVSAGAAWSGAVASIKYFLFSPERKRSKFPCARLMTVPQHWLCWLGHNCTGRHQAYPGPAAALNTERVCNSLSAARADQ